MSAEIAHDAELERATRALASISETLVESYRALDARARRVEQELAQANAELERKVRELARVNAHLEAVLGALPCGVIVRDADGRIARANAAALELSGAAPAPAPAPGAGERVVETRGADGARRVVATKSSRIAGRDGRARGCVEIHDDRTALVELTERMHALDKMAALGTMGGGIAHEIRNPLNAVKGFAELLERELPAGSKAARWAERIVAGAAEADAIIESLLAFASPERLKQDAIDAEALCADAARVALGDRPAHALAVVADAPAFLGDRIKLRQALRNLIANAAQVQPAGGRIEVCVKKQKDELVLCVRDSGPGIKKHERARVLDPFYTTRPEGTGLGLALVATIARLHGGAVEVKDAPPRLGGAEIALRIPFLSAPHAPHVIAA